MNNKDFEGKVIKCCNLQMPNYIYYGIKGLIISQCPPGPIKTLILIVSLVYQDFNLDKLYN